MATTYYRLQLMMHPGSPFGLNGRFDSSNLMSAPAPDGPWSNAGDGQTFAAHPGDELSIMITAASGSNISAASLIAVFGRSDRAGNSAIHASPFSLAGAGSTRVRCQIKDAHSDTGENPSWWSDFWPVGGRFGHFRFLVFASATASGAPCEFGHDPEMEVTGLRSKS